jgi:hypothetical protein
MIGFHGDNDRFIIGIKRNRGDRGCLTGEEQRKHRNQHENHDFLQAGFPP